MNRILCGLPAFQAGTFRQIFCSLFVLVMLSSTPSEMKGAAMNERDEQDLLCEIQLALKLDQYWKPSSGVSADNLYYRSVSKYLLDRLRRSWTITRKPALLQSVTSAGGLFPPNMPPFRGCEDC
jgi:hypothetical protein